MYFVLFLFLAQESFGAFIMNGKMETFRGQKDEKTVRTLVVGAGAGGHIFISSIVRHPGDIDIVGIVDSDASKETSRLYDIPIMGTEKDIPELVNELDVDQVTIAIPS